MTELVAKVFIASLNDRGKVASLLLEHTNAQPLTDFAGALGSIEFEVVRNPDRDAPRLWEEEFLHSPLVVEVLAEGRVSAPELVPVLLPLIEAGIGYVVASDLEEELGEIASHSPSKAASKSSWWIMSERGDRLSNAGWYQGRSADHRPALDRLESDGHLVADWFAVVVSELDGLVLEFDRNGRSDQVVLAPAEAGRRWYPARIGSYGARVGGPLLPIGYSYHEHLVLLVAENGDWYAGHEDELWRIGGSAHEAMESLISGSGFDPVD